MDFIATPARTREILKKYGIKLKKSLGQNFLVEQKVLGKIVEAAELDREQVVVEIGPGIGALTQVLATRAGQVVAVEIDRYLTEALQEIFVSWPNVTIIHDDALKVDFNRIAGEAAAKGPSAPGYKVVANLPYYITTPVIMRLLEEGFNFSALVLMIQREVARRMTAVPGTKEYGALSIGVQYYCMPRLVAIVPPTVFYPRPEVESALIKLVKRDSPPVRVTDEKLFFSLVRAAFGQRRKTLLNALTNSGWSLTKECWERILVESGINPERRGETLSLEEFASLTNHLGSSKR